MKDRFLAKEDVTVNLFKVNDESNSGVVTLNHIMSKLLTLSKFLQLKCLQIKSCLQIATSFFEHAERFWKIIWGYYIYNWWLLAINNTSRSFQITNQTCPPSNISESIKIQQRACGRNNQQFFLSKQQNIWSRDKARNILIGKKGDGQRKIPNI